MLSANKTQSTQNQQKCSDTPSKECSSGSTCPTSSAHGAWCWLWRVVAAVTALFFPSGTLHLILDNASISCHKNFSSTVHSNLEKLWSHNLLLGICELRFILKMMSQMNLNGLVVPSVIPAYDQWYLGLLCMLGSHHTNLTCSSYTSSSSLMCLETGQERIQTLSRIVWSVTSARSTSLSLLKAGLNIF